MRTGCKQTESQVKLFFSKTLKIIGRKE